MIEAIYGRAALPAGEIYRMSVIQVYVRARTISWRRFVPIYQKIYENIHARAGTEYGVYKTS